jgi:hypothetical protein
MNYKKCQNKLDFLSNENFDEYSDIIYIILYEMNELSYLCYDKNSFIEIIDNSRNVDIFSNLYKNTDNKSLYKIHNNINIFEDSNVFKDSIFESHNLYHAIKKNHVYNKYNKYNKYNSDYILYEIIPVNYDFIDFNEKQKHQFLELPIKYRNKIFNI